MKKLLLALLLLLAPTAASAQCNGIFPTGTVCGNISGSSNVPRPVPGSSLPGLGLIVDTTTITGGTSTGFLYNKAGVLGNTNFLELITNSASTPTVKAGTNPGVGDDTAFLAARALAPASGLLNSHAFRDETAAVSNATGSLFSGYASFDAAPVFTGLQTTPMNHIHGFQARPVYNAVGQVDDVSGYTSQAEVRNAGGLIANSYGFFVASPIISAGGITNQYAFYSNPLSGATNTFFLYGSGVNGSTANPSVLNGNLYVGGQTAQVNVEVQNIQYDGSTRFGLLLNDTLSSAGAATAVSFYRNTSAVGSISETLSATSYNTSSDERLKDFTGHLDPNDAIRLIRADPVRTFKWKASGQSAVGWGAQTSYALSHDLASPGTKPEDIWGMDLAKRTPYLWAAVAQLVDRVDYLEKQLAKRNHAQHRASK